MSLYDDIEPTIKRPRTPERKLSDTKNDEVKSNAGKSKDNDFASVSMFAPRALMSKTSRPTPSRPLVAPSMMKTIYTTPLEPPTAPSVSNSTANTSASVKLDFNEIKNQVLQKKLEIQMKMNPVANKSKPDTILPMLQPHKVDVTKIQAVPLIPFEAREDTECLFDEVHIIDEYNPTKPNSYFEFMKSINCNPQFGEEFDDFKLERMIQDEIIEGQAERERSPTPEPEKEVVSGTDVAANIMAKMGYTHGQGLGKHGQGMSSALKVEKKSGQAGKIVSEVDEVMRSVGLNPETFNRPITHVLLLRNLYTSDDLPDDYEDELRPELSRYGVIRKLIIHQQDDEDPLEQVRIFVDYPNKAAAIRAFADLNSRHFNAREIRADFYPTDRFNLGHYSDYV